MRTASGVTYRHSDHLGSTSVTTNAGGGCTSAQWYKPYGENRTPAPTLPCAGSAPTDFGFTGQRKEVSAGLMYYGARYYDAGLGRFVQPDTFIPKPHDPQTLNRYSYVMNNPLKYTDPSGHCFWDACVLEFLGLTGATFAVGSSSSYYGSQQVIQNRQALAVAVEEGINNAGVNLGEGVEQQKLKILAMQVGIQVLTNGITERIEIGANQGPLGGGVIQARGRSGEQVAAHLAMLLGGLSVGGIPPHDGDPDKEGRDRKHNAEGLRNSLKEELRNIERNWGKSREPNLERWLQEKGMEQRRIDEILDSLRNYEQHVLDNDVNNFRVSQKMADELRDLLGQLGVP